MKKEREAGRETFTQLEDENKLSEDNLYRLATEAIGKFNKINASHQLILILKSLSKCALLDS